MSQTNIRKAVGSRVLFLLAALLAASLVFTRPAHAADFTVTSTNDSGAGSLRQAILNANASRSADTIRFAIPGSGVKSISLSSELPEITGPVTIDGYSQPGASPNTLVKGTNAKLLVELNGDNGVSEGLRIAASNVVVRGLVVKGFSGNGIDISGKKAKGNRIEGNIIGADAAGDGSNLNNGGSGVSISDTKGKHIIGGALPEARNLISNNRGNGIAINRDKGSNQVQGNLIGTKKDGVTPLNNSLSGVGIRDSSNNTVGGAEPGTANTIAFNIGGGVEVAGNSLGNRILGNSIFTNDFFGDAGSIDLGADGRTTNDERDADKGPNNLQNFPVVTSAGKFSGGKTVIQGTLDSIPSKKKKQNFTIQLFLNSRDENEGKTFLGEVKVSTDREGKASFSFETIQPTTSGERITATATDKSGNTSEFSDPETVTLGPGQG